MTILETWRTPFASASWPGIWITAERDIRKTTVFVQAERFWRLQFDYIVGLRVCNESSDDNTRFHVERDEQDKCSYIWNGSPWLKEFCKEETEAVEGGTLTHYVLLGGDHNIEVLALGEVSIDPVSSLTDA
ncbi:MAG: hypothetical protein ABI646_08280 [Acidobacteriota bacterium]